MGTEAGVLPSLSPKPLSLEPQMVEESGQVRLEISGCGARSDEWFRFECSRSTGTRYLFQLAGRRDSAAKMFAMWAFSLGNMVRFQYVGLGLGL